MNFKLNKQLQDIAYSHFEKQEYEDAQIIFQEIINSGNGSSSDYCYLGLCLFLIGEIAEAEINWLKVLDKSDIDSLESGDEQFINFLDAEAEKQKDLKKYDLALPIRNVLRDLNPHDFYNLISIVNLFIKKEAYVSSCLIDLNVVNLLETGELTSLDESFFIDFLERILIFTDCDETTLNFVEKLCSYHSQYLKIIIERLPIVSIYLNNQDKKDQAVRILEMGLRFEPDNKSFLRNLIDFCLTTDNPKAIQTAKRLYEISQDSHAINRVIACESMTRTLIVNCLYWQESKQFYQEYIENLKELVNCDYSDLIKYEEVSYLITTGFYYPYFSDQPRARQLLMKEVRQIANQKIYQDYQDKSLEYKKRLALRKTLGKLDRPLRIGYLSSCMRRHSVGYLARWLVQNHNHDDYEIYGYMGNAKEDPLRKWYISQFHKSYTDPIPNHPSFASQIQKDGIDVLIDLDSVTYGCAAIISVLKPAPIQATWLGWDSLSQDSIDYFIADPYVLPEDANEYYPEKIWRLPQTYIAVDGFESATPTVRRDTLDIPDDAVIYFSAQASMKRHPDTIRLQMQVIKSVPNAYLVLKSYGDQDSLKEFFYKIAEAEGVNTDRLRFLTITNSEAEHRANLIIADVILDTYPYNGATHTLETLWMGIPMVTRVGEQFSARNSYTMMINAGINEGIAWTDAEYVEWGIRLGTDHDLRNHVILKLRQGRQTAPLWNSRQFTRDMESAYEQMWQIWLDTEEPEIEIDPVADRELFIAEAELRNQDAIRLAQKGKLDSAIACWQAAISLHPEYIDAYYNMGIAQVEVGNLEDAIASFQTTIELDPNHANALYNLGLALSRENKLDEAITAYDRAFELNPEDIDIPLALGSAFFKQGEWEWAINAYQSALEINPESALALGGLGVTLTEFGEIEEAIACLQSAISIDPNDAHVYGDLAHAFARAKQIEDASFCYQRAIKLDPAFGQAYWNYNNDILANIENPANRNYKFRMQLADQFLASCYEVDKILSLVNFLTNYANSGHGDIAKERILEVENLVLESHTIFSKTEIQVLYNHLLFILPNLRDHRQNISIYKLIGEMYRQRIIQTKISSEVLSCLRAPKENLKIGFISPHFARHPVGWCSLDVIRELSNITPHIYLYATSEIKVDERTREFAQVAEKSYWYDGDEFEGKVNSFDSRLDQVIEDITQDQLDVIIDLDSVTIPINTHILCRNLAPVCLSWLGFDAPFVSSENYWLGDRFTHPEGVDEYYLEKILRLPDAHMAVSGFESIEIDRDIEREKLDIASDQVAYLYAAPARKFNRDSARACLSIVQQVPNSVLLHKGNGDHEVIRHIYQEICDEIGVTGERVIFLPSYKTEEEHRGIYAIADVFLDSYPYNGGSHNLEVLWFNLPVVTLVGEQSFARMGYSFLQALGIDAGIAHNWEEYMTWAVKYGLESEFRNSIKQKLIDSKNPTNLAPLWNPQKLAMDMYVILQTLLNK
ncbi:tetratricopeptide repeat protein [Pseudanabaena galeata UHCC 0370]|uniref:protein O-GlcNAc transferase n=1 Tax=Pseudanabaena galeata UHCC 0370 TaxID=3110310 RepID=A0ABU5TJH2_9CYAN|nr:tetratricopeptide repeat protein [Pseudanabaena galeata]MEA5478436.1 tetratricopeptide repeat protein [Pseudanabaena galeata UHCC 0370]